MSKFFTSLRESSTGVHRRSLRESWQDAKKLTPEEAVAEIAEGFRSLDYEATSSGRDIIVKFEDLDLKLHCAFQTRDCLGRDLDPKSASSFVVYWAPEGKDPLELGFVVGWFDWKTALKGSYVICGQKCAVHLGRDGGAADIRRMIDSWSKESEEAKLNSEHASV